MTWTKEDTRDLRALVDWRGGDGLPSEGRRAVRDAAAHIEALAARVAMLEKKYDCHPQGGVIGCDCWECLRAELPRLRARAAELARLRAVCAEVAGELRDKQTYGDGKIAERLEAEAGAK